MDILATYWDLLNNGRDENAPKKIKPLVDEILHALSLGRSQGRIEYDLLAPVSRRLVETSFYVWLYESLGEVSRKFGRGNDAQAYFDSARNIEALEKEE